MVSNAKSAAALVVVALMGVCVAASQWGEQQKHSAESNLVEELAVSDITDGDVVRSFEADKAREMNTDGTVRPVTLEKAQAARGAKNGRSKKSRRKGIGLWKGKQFEYGKRSRVLMQDGSGLATLELELRPVDCAEKIVGYSVKKYSHKILREKDVSVSWDRYDGDVSMGKFGCAANTYNITADINFNLLPGKTDVNLCIFTNQGGKKRMYTFKTSYIVVGLVLYEKTAKKGIVIRSGDGHTPRRLGNFKKIRKHIRRNGPYRMSVAVQGPDGTKAPKRGSLDIRAYDPNCDSWPRTINWDNSCPSAYITKKGMRRPRKRSNNFRDEGYQCNASFTKDVKYFFFLPNKNRVGCGKLCFEVTWPALKVNGNVFTTHFCFTIEQTPSPPVVVDCVKMEPDYYGGDQFSFDAFNLDAFRDNELGAGTPSVFRFGSAAWDVTAVRMSPVNQVVTLRSPPLEDTGSSNSTSSTAANGWFEFERSDGSIYKVPSRVQCASDGRNGEIAVKYRAPLLAQPEPVGRTSSADTETVEVQIFTPFVEKTSAERVGRYLAALPVAGGRLVGARSTEEALRHQSFMCALRTFASGLGLVDAGAEDREHGTEVKIHLEVDPLDIYEVVDRLSARADEFSAQVGDFGVRISYVGEPRETFETVDTRC